MSKPTPGPWFHGKDDARRAWANMIVRGREHDDKGIAQVYGVPDNHTVEEAEAIGWAAEGLANARLIAQAPALLGALEQALSANGRTVGQAIDEVPLEPWEVEARRILAEVKGGK